MHQSLDYNWYVFSYHTKMISSWENMIWGPTIFVRFGNFEFAATLAHVFGSAPHIYVYIYIYIFFFIFFSFFLRGA